MNKKQNILLQILAVTFDSAAIVLGSMASYSIRFSELITEYIPIVTALPPFSWYVGLSVIFVALNIVIFISNRMYSFPRPESGFDEAMLTVRHYLTAYLVLLAVLFFYRGASYSRLTMTLLLFFCGSSLILSRLLGRYFREWLYRHKFAVRRAAIVGNGAQLSNVLQHLKEHPDFGISVVGCIGAASSNGNALMSLGSIGNAGKTVRENKIDTLIVTHDQSEPDILSKVVKACYGVNVDFLYLPDIQPVDGRPKRIVEVGGVPLWTLKENPFEGWKGILKRGSDLLLSSFFLVFSSPIMILLMIAVKLDSRGPFFYKQRRVGLDGSEFDVIKFRSMRVDAEEKTGAVWATENDSRVTRLGKFLRRWSIDELPQFWNVFRGDMSMVGPRPERPEFVQQFEKSIDGYQERHRVRTGITGWAQVNGLRGDTPIEDRTKYDRFYVENWSLVFDMKIMLLTAQAVFKGENAY